MLSPHLLGCGVVPSPPELWCCPLTLWAVVLPLIPELWCCFRTSWAMVLTPHLLSGGIVPSLLSCGVGLSPPELGCEEQCRCSCSMPCCSPRVAAIPWERVAVLVICFNLRNRNPLKPSQTSKIYYGNTLELKKKSSSKDIQAQKL